MNPQLPRHGATLLLGILLGTSFATFVLRQTSSDSAVSTPVAVGLPTTTGEHNSSKVQAATPEPKADPAHMDGSLCQSELAEIQMQFNFLQRQVSLLGGARSEWPEDLDAVFAGPSVRSWLDGAMAEFETGELEALDCNEYPCVGFFRLPEGQERTTMLATLSDDFAEHSGARGSSTSFFSTSYGSWGSIVFSPDLSDEDVVKRRLQVRVKEMAEVFTNTPPM